MKLKTLLTVLTLTFCAHVLRAQELWMLHQYDETNSSLEGHTTQILQDRNGFLWIATWNGIYRFDGYDFCRMKPNLSDTCSMTSDRIRDIWLAKNGDIYVQNDERIFHFDIRTYRFRNLRDSLEHAEAVQQRDDQPTRGRFTEEKRLEYIDPQGLLWMFHKDALFCMSRVESPAKPFPMEKPTMLLYAMTDSHKQTWVSTKEDRTLRLFDSEGQLIGYMGPGGTLSSSYQEFGRSAYVIKETSDKRVWVGTKPDGLFRVTPFSAPGTPSRYSVDFIEGIDVKAVYGVAEDKSGRLWISTLGGGISVIPDPQAEKPTVLNHLKGFPDSVCQRVRHIHINRKGILLAATTEGLLTSHIGDDPQQMVFHRHTKDPERPASLSCNATMDIAETPEGRLFVATETGGVDEILSEDLLADTLTFKHYDMASGRMPTDITIGMTVMSNGHLLVTSNTKLINLDVTNDRFESIGHHFFHHVYKFSQMRPLLMPNGHWLFGCLDSGFTLPASAMHHNNYQPPLQLTSINFSNAKPLLAVTHLDTLRLRPSERSLTIHFAALDYIDPQAINYQYKLGNDTLGAWNNLGHAHSITLLDLDPGTYHLALRSTNADAVWTDNTRTLTIIVEPLFWETLWAQLLFALLIVAAMAGGLYIFIYTRRLKRKQYDTLQKYLLLMENSEKAKALLTPPEGGTIDSPLKGQSIVASSGAEGGASGGTIDETSKGKTVEAPSGAVGGASGSSEDDLFMRRVMAFVEKNISNNEADIAAMADACAVSRSVLQRRMKLLVGLTPTDFLREARMKHAERLLRSTDIPVADVAYRCGFNDPKYFSRCFRQSSGMTPTEFKNK